VLPEHCSPAAVETRFKSCFKVNLCTDVSDDLSQRGGFVHNPTGSTNFVAVATCQLAALGTQAATVRIGAAVAVSKATTIEGERPDSGPLRS